MSYVYVWNMLNKAMMYTIYKISQHLENFKDKITDWSHELSIYTKQLPFL